MNKYKEVFSEFEVKETSIRVGSEEASELIGCVGESEETLDTRVIIKKCEGRIKKRKVRGAGTGKLRLSLHMKYSLFVKTLGMYFEEAKPGVYSYGEASKHEEFCITQKVLDEEGNLKYKAYPRAIIEEGITRKVKNGEEEVAEIALNISLLPDEKYGQCVYEAIASILEDADLKEQWMSNFNAEDTYIVEA